MKERSLEDQGQGTGGVTPAHQDQGLGAEDALGQGIVDESMYFKIVQILSNKKLLQEVNR